MAKQLFEIKDFSSGLMTNADLKDLPDGASRYVHGISPNSGFGIAESIYDNAVIMDNIPAITSMVTRPGLELNSPSDLAVNIDRYLINIPAYRSDTGLSEFYKILEKGELIINGDFSEEGTTGVPSHFYNNAPEASLQGADLDPEDQSSGLMHLRLKNNLATNTNSKFRLWLKVDVQPGFMYKFGWRLNTDLAWTGQPGGAGEFRNPIGCKLYCMDAKYDDAGAMRAIDSEEHFPINNSDSRILSTKELQFNLGGSDTITFIPTETTAFLCFDFNAEEYGAPVDNAIGYDGGHQAYLTKLTCKLFLGTYLFKELGENLDMSDSDRGLFVSGENIVPHIMHQAYDSDGDVSRYIAESECTAYLSKYSISNIDQMVAVPSLTGTMPNSAGFSGEVGVDPVICVFGEDALYRIVTDADSGEETEGSVVIETMQGDLMNRPIGGMCVARESSEAHTNGAKYDNYTKYLKTSNTATGYEFEQESGLNEFADVDLHNNLFVYDYQGYKIHKIYFESTTTDQTPTPKIKYSISIDPSDVSGHINGIAHSYGQDADGYHYIFFSVFKAGGLKASKEGEVGDGCIYAVRDKQGIQEVIPLYKIPSYMHLTAYTGWHVRRNWLGMRRDVNPTGARDFYWPTGGSYIPVSYHNGSNKDEDHMTAYGYTNDVCWINTDANDVALNIPNNSIDTIDRIFEKKDSSFKQVTKRSTANAMNQADLIVFATRPLGKTAFLEHSGVCHKIIQNPYWIPDSWGSADGWWTHIDQHQTIQEGSQLVVVRPWNDKTTVGSLDDDDYGVEGIKKFKLDLRPARSDNLQEQKQKMINALTYFRENQLPGFPSSPVSTGLYNHPDEEYGGCFHSVDHPKYSPNYKPSVYNHLKNGFNALKNHVGSSNANLLLDSLASDEDPDMELAQNIINVVKTGSTDRILTYFNYSDSYAGYTISGWSSFSSWHSHWVNFTTAKQAIDSDLSEQTIAGFNRDYIRHYHISDEIAPSNSRRPSHLFAAIYDPDWFSNNENNTKGTAWKNLYDVDPPTIPDASPKYEPSHGVIFTEELYGGANNILPWRATIEDDKEVNLSQVLTSDVSNLTELMNSLNLRTSSTYNRFTGSLSDNPGKKELNFSMTKALKYNHGGGDHAGVRWDAGDDVPLLEAVSCFSPPGFITNMKGTDQYQETDEAQYRYQNSPNYHAEGLWHAAYSGSLRLDKIAMNKSSDTNAFRGIDEAGAVSGFSDIASTWSEGVSPGIECTPGTTVDAADAYLTTGETCLYNISLLFDGYQEGPLLPTPVTYTADGPISGVDVTVSVTNKNPRITHVQLYKKKDILDDWRMIGSRPIDNDWKPTGVAQNYQMQGTVSHMFEDNANVTGVAYSAITGIPETLNTTMVNYEESATAGDYMFVARADIEGMADAHKLIFRSEPGKFSIFNWPQNYVGIDEVPITMLGVQNRLYVWSEKAMYVIDPFNMIVEDRIPGKGVNSRHAVMNYNNLVVFANETGVYAFEGKVVDLSFPIKDEYLDTVREIGNKFKIKLAHNPKHDAIMLFFDNAGTASVDIVPTDVYVYTMKSKRWDKWKFPSKIKAITTSEDNTCLICAESDSVKSYSESGMAQDKDGNLLDEYTYALYELHEGDVKVPIEFHTKNLTMGTDSRLKKFKKLKLTGKDVYICRVEIDGFFREYTEDDATVSNGYIQTLDLRNSDGVVIGTPSTTYGLEDSEEPYTDPETGEEVWENRNLDFNLTGSYISIHIKSKANAEEIDPETGEVTILKPESSIESIGVIYSVKAIK